MSGNFLFDIPVSWEYNSKNPRLKLENISLQKEVLNTIKFVMNALIFPSISVVPDKSLGCIVTLPMPRQINAVAVIRYSDILEINSRVITLQLLLVLISFVYHSRPTCFLFLSWVSKVSTLLSSAKHSSLLLTY